MPDAGSKSPHLEKNERKQAADNAPIPARVVHEIVREEGEDALDRQTPALIWSGLAAGLSMGFSFLTEGLLRGRLPDAPWRHLVESLGYSVGFTIVIMGKQQLFTESTLSAVLPVLVRRDRKSVLACLRLWGYVLVSNLVGTCLFSAVLAFGRPVTEETAAALASIAAEAIEGAFWPKLLQGIFAGWLIALMAWMLPSVRGERLITIVFVTYVVALAGLTHVVAGSAEAFYAVLVNGASLASYALGFVLPTLIGNVIGGVLLVAILNHAPLAPELAGAGAAGSGKDRDGHSSAKPT